MSIVLSRSRFPTLLIVFVAGAWLTRSAEPLTSSPPIETSLGGRQTTNANSEAAGAAAAHAQCATCHKWPPPEILPRGRWRDEIARMFLIQNNQPEPSGPPGTAARMVKLPVDWQSIVGYYEANAPERLAPLASWPPPDRASAFRKRVVSTASRPTNQAVANVRLVDLDRDDGSRSC